ncbi:MAG: ABC transporter substrate-binding protein [Spirochaetaceae bacterium]|jgi:putative aldouronate transport system substrate-binding protein|nr:ABC transporter substrate-binding protein [Spirochaetaceae bacterium]
MKKNILCVLAFCAFFTACGGKKAAESGVPVLTWWFYGSTPSNLRDGLTAINEYIEPKIRARLDIKVSSWAEAGQRMRTIVNSGEYFDIMFIDLNDYNNFVRLGAYADLTDMLASDAQDLQSAIPAMLWDGVRINGKIYAVPTYKDSSKTRFFVWDNKYVQKYNIDIANVHTFAELDTALRTIKQGEGGRFYPLQLSQGSLFDTVYADDYDSMTANLPPIGVGLHDANRKVVSVFEQPAVQEKLRYLHRWYADGLVNPDGAVTLEAPKQLPFFTAIGWPAAVSTWQVNNGVETYVLEKVFGPSYSTDAIQGSMNAISANSKYKTESLKLLELVNTDHKLRDMMAFGIEGTNFSYVTPNKVKLLTADQWNLARYQQGTFFTMSIVEGDPEDTWDQVRQQNEQATPSILLGFAFDNKDVINEIASCKTVYDKYKNELLTGASDPDTVIPAMMQDLNDAGFQKVIASAQAQVDAFKP